MKLIQVCFVMTFFLSILTSGCASDGSQQNSPAGAAVTDGVFSPTQAEAEIRLKEMVTEQIQSEKQYDNTQAVPVIKRRPYYFKEYAVYPDGPDGFDVEFREIDSRTRPLMAEVNLNKIRYSTHMHRKYNLAASDSDFLRDTGKETLVFEWRNGRWTRTGAIFDAEKTEENINGQWAPRREETVRVNPEEDRPGWFGRIWQRIRGGE
jgi:hypothetical protein